MQGQKAIARQVRHENHHSFIQRENIKADGRQIRMHGHYPITLNSRCTVINNTGADVKQEEQTTYQYVTKVTNEVTGNQLQTRNKSQNDQTCVQSKNKSTRQGMSNLG